MLLGSLKVLEIFVTKRVGTLRVHSIVHPFVRLDSSCYEQLEQSR